MHIVVYRPHNQLNTDTQYIGPFTSWIAAYEHLCEMPALGQYQPDGILDNPGVKFVDRLVTLTAPHTCLAAKGLDE